MALEIGSRIAHYDVTALIGEGEVYAARDTTLANKLERRVLTGRLVEGAGQEFRGRRRPRVRLSAPVIFLHGLLRSVTDSSRPSL